MDKINFTPFEETLYMLSSSNGRIQKFKGTTVMTGGLFCVLFCGIIYFAGVNLFVLPLLAAYAIVKTLEILRFSKIIGTYRSIAIKIDGRIAERTKGEDAEKACRELADSNNTAERFLRMNMMLLAAFYMIYLAASWYLFPSQKALSYAVGGGSCVFILLTVRLNLVAADLIESFKARVFKEGKRLKEMTYPE